MNWVYVGVLLGSLVTSQHETEEACLGRKALLSKREVVGDCHNTRPMGIVTGVGTLLPNSGKNCYSNNDGTWGCR